MTAYSPAQRRYVLFAAIVASSMGFLDGSVTAIITPAIRSALGGSLADMQWVTNAYLLTLSSLLLLGGAASDRFGLRNVFAGGIVLFVVASLGAALAPNAAFLIALRAIQGIGAAFMVPGSLAIIAEAYPPDERGRAVGIWAAASSITTLFGPVVGGALLSWTGDASWRIVFIVNLPLGALALFLLLATPNSRVANHRALDTIGAALAGIGLFLLSWAFIGEAERLPVTLGAGIVILAIFLFWETRAKSPILPLGLFRDRRFWGAQAATGLIYFVATAVPFYLPMVMIAGWGASPADVAFALLPLGVALVLLSTPAGTLTDRFGPGPMITGGAVLVTLACVGLGLAASLHAVWTGVLPLMIVFGIGMSGIAGPISTAVMGAVAEGETGTASAINNAVARVAGLLAVATMGGLATLVFAGLAPQGASFGAALPADTAARLAQIAATDTAFAMIAYFCAALTLGGAILSWLTLERRART